jgi:predicted component of type VI protein secretion system
MNPDEHRARAEALTAAAEQLLARLDTSAGVEAKDLGWMAILTQLAQAHAALAVAPPSSGPRHEGPGRDAGTTPGFVDYGDGEPTHDRR